MLSEINSVKSKRKFNSEHAIHLDRVSVMDQIATELGVLPDFDQIKQNDPKLYDMIWNKWVYSFKYSTESIHSNQLASCFVHLVFIQSDYLSKTIG